MIGNIDGVDPAKAFRDHESKANQLLFKERQVDNLMSLIYNQDDDG